MFQPSDTNVKHEESFKFGEEIHRLRPVPESSQKGGGTPPLGNRDWRVARVEELNSDRISILYKDFHWHVTRTELLFV